VAAPPSPLYVVLPVPAMVDIIPVEIVTLRIRWLLESEIYKFPAESRYTSKGPFNPADVAAPPSPENPLDPVPANVVMMPVDAVTLRIRWFQVSAI
jgi:hypothetical protein